MTQYLGIKTKYFIQSNKRNSCSDNTFGNDSYLRALKELNFFLPIKRLLNLIYMSRKREKKWVGRRG